MSYLHWLLPHKYLANLLADQLRISLSLSLLFLCICLRVKSQFRSVGPPPPLSSPRTSLCPQRICRKQIKFKSQIKNKLTNVHKGGKGGAEEGAEGKQKTQQQLSAVSSGDTPPIHTHTHIHSHTHPQINTHCCVYLVPCVDYFWKSFPSWWASETAWLSRNIRHKSWEETSIKMCVSVRVCVCDFVCVYGGHIIINIFHDLTPC